MLYYLRYPDADIPLWLVETDRPLHPGDSVLVDVEVPGDPDGLLYRVQAIIEATWAGESPRPGTRHAAVEYLYEVPIEDVPPSVIRTRIAGELAIDRAIRLGQG